LLLTLNTRQVGEVTIIRCGGRIVAGPEAESLRQHVHELLLDRRDILLHLGEVAFIDSSGLGMLVRVLTSTRRLGGEVKLCHVPDAILKVLRMTNVVELFDLYESEQEAVSSFYRRETVPMQMASSGPTVLCVDQSADVLVCLREILRNAGYQVLTNSNLHDALILVRATRPSLLVLGCNLPASPSTQQVFRDACAALPVVELGASFSKQDAGHAASELLTKIRSCVQPNGVA
jgi:anti-sigma B factor antagonist